MNLAPRTDLCKCPADKPEYVSIACPEHFGDGFGFCVVCLAEEIIKAATGARDGSGFCAPHLAPGQRCFRCGEIPGSNRVS